MAGFLGTDGVSYNATPLDAGSNQLINGAIERSQRPTSSFGDASLAGTNAAADQAKQTTAQSQQSDARMGYNEGGGAINQAIRNQYNSQAGSQIHQMQNAYNQNAEFQKSASLQQAAAMAMARQNIQTQSYERLMKSYNDSETARAQVLQSILGGAGSAAGMYAANNQMHKPRTPKVSGSAGYVPGDTGSMQQLSANNTEGDFYG